MPSAAVVAAVAAACSATRVSTFARSWRRVSASVALAVSVAFGSFCVSTAWVASAGASNSAFVKRDCAAKKTISRVCTGEFILPFIIMVALWEGGRGGHGEDWQCWAYTEVAAQEDERFEEAICEEAMERRRESM